MPVRGKVETGARAIRHVVLEALGGRSGEYYDVEELSRARPEAYDCEFRARSASAHRAGRAVSRGLAIPL